MSGGNKAMVDKYRDWKRSHPSFPLTVQPVGQWSKKVRGKVHYFGPLGDPDAAPLPSLAMQALLANSAILVCPAPVNFLR